MAEYSIVSVELVPLGLPEDELRDLYDRLDGLLLSGGGDISPNAYGMASIAELRQVDEDRDRVELTLTRWAAAEDKPLLGICRGAQTFNVALGGTLYRDIATQHPGRTRHDYYPQVTRAVEFGLHDGALQENDRYIQKADPMKAASGGNFIFSRQEFESAKVSMIERHAKDSLFAAQAATRLQLMCETVVRTKNKKHRSARIDQLIGVLEQYVQANVGVAVLAGAIGEDEKYLQRLDAGIRAAGGAKSEAVLLAQVTPK